MNRLLILEPDASVYEAEVKKPALAQGRIGGAGSPLSHPVDFGRGY